MKLELRKNCIDASTIINKEITHSDKYGELVGETNEEIKKCRDKQLKAIQRAKNYIHDYDNLPVVKEK